MGDSNTKPLAFLGTCLPFAESALGTLAGFTDADATIVAALAMGSLGMVLLALVVMHIREPAFLTFTGQQALDFRVLQENLDKTPPEYIGSYLGSLMAQADSQGHLARIAGSEEPTEEEAEAIEMGLVLLRAAENEAEI